MNLLLSQVAFVLLQTDGEEPLIDPTIMYAMTAVLLVLSIVVGYWVYKDASKRENNELLWAIGTAALLFFTFVFGLVALVAYFILRGDETAAESVETGTDEDWGTSQSDADETDW